MTARGLSCDPASAARPLAEGLAWLWRLPLEDRAGPGLVELTTRDSPPRTRGAGAVVLGHDAEPAEAVADVGGLGRVHGRFTVIGSGEPVTTSALGTHAAVEDGVLRVAAGTDGEWGRLTSAWVLDAIATFLEGRAGLKLTRLPPLGVIRLDDFPGTAEIQARGNARSDRSQRRRAVAMVRAAKRAGSVLNVAVPARALEDGEEVPLDRVWPRSIAELRNGVEAGCVEAVCHGLLHLQAAELGRGRVEQREFANLDAHEARRRVELAVRWQREALGPPATFVAPAWGYSEGALEALDALAMPHWMPRSPGPLVRGHRVHETLEDGPPGMAGLDYRPLAALARLGMPPVVVLHGRMLDGRHLDPRPSKLELACLALRRDIHRLPGVDGVRWVGCGELVEALRAHDRA